MCFSLILYIYYFYTLSFFHIFIFHLCPRAPSMRHSHIIRNRSPQRQLISQEAHKTWPYPKTAILAVPDVTVGAINGLKVVTRRGLLRRRGLGRERGSIACAQADPPLDTRKWRSWWIWSMVSSMENGNTTRGERGTGGWLMSLQPTELLCGPNLIAYLTLTSISLETPPRLGLSLLSSTIAFLLPCLFTEAPSPFSSFLFVGFITLFYERS